MIGLKFWDYCDVFEQMCDLVVEYFLVIIGLFWLFCMGLKVLYCGFIFVVVDSCVYFLVKWCKEIEVYCFEGMWIVFLGGDYQVYDLIWFVFDVIYVKYFDMVFLYGGMFKGVEMIVVCWVDICGVIQVVFKFDWKSYGKVVFFKCNDKMFEMMLQGLIVIFGLGIIENIVDKVCKFGICIKRIGVQVLVLL